LPDASGFRLGKRANPQILPMRRIARRAALAAPSGGAAKNAQDCAGVGIPARNRYASRTPSYEVRSLAHRLTRDAFKVGSIAVCLSCAAREPELVCMNELDVPGECPTTRPPPPPLEVVTAGDSVAGHILGRVLDSEVGAPVAFAQVRSAAPSGVQATADSLGHFHLAVGAGSRQVFRITMIGYASRTDTLELPGEGALLHDGPPHSPAGGWPVQRA
jgi:hypothetical protein